MARDLNFSPTVTNVTPLEPDTGTITNTIAAIGDKLAEQSSQSKLILNSANAQVGFKQLDAKFRQDYASDPTNPQGLSDLKAARQQLVTSLGTNVPTLVMRDFTNKTIELGEQSDAANELWAGKQQARNTVSNLQTSQETYWHAASTDGRAFGASNDMDLSTALNYVQANKTLSDGATPIIGSEKTGALLKNFNINYVKSFVAGVAEQNPQKAAALLNDDNIKQHFTAQDIGDMNDLIKRTQRQQQLNQSLQVVQGQSALPDLVNDPGTTYFEKRAAIDQLDMQGAISPKAAASARRVIKSSTDLDSQTDTPVMADIIKKVYDLNENSSLKQSEYLNGVKDLQENVMQMQDAGQLTGGDATKLNKEISTLTQKRMADATKSVGYQFGSANKQFDALPPQYRGQATRQLFYSSYGQNLSQDQLNNNASQIVDSINKQRRDDALSIIARTTNDDVFLQATGYTRADVAATAQKRGLSPEQVIQALRSKYTKKQARPGRASRTAPEDGPEGTPAPDGIRLSEPPPNDSGDNLEDEGGQ